MTIKVSALFSSSSSSTTTLAVSNEITPSQILSMHPERRGKVGNLCHRIKLLLAERFFFEEIAQASTPLKYSIEMQEFLRSYGYQFLATPRRAVSIPLYPESTPWPIMAVISYMERFSIKSCLGLVNYQEIEPAYRNFIIRLMSFSQEFPEFKEMIDHLFLYIDYSVNRMKFHVRRDRFNSTIIKMEEFVQAHKEFVFFERVQAVFVARRIHISRYQKLYDCKQREPGLDLIAAKNLAQQDDDEQKWFCNELRKAALQYLEILPQRTEKYREIYSEITKKVHQRNASAPISSIFSEEDRSVWSRLLLPPEKFGILDIFAEATSFVERVKDEYLAQIIEQQKPSRPVSKKPSSSCDKIQSKIKTRALPRDCSPKPVELYPHKLKNWDFADAEHARFDPEKTGPLLPIGAVFSGSKIACSAKAKTNSSACLGIKPGPSESLKKAQDGVQISPQEPTQPHPLPLSTQLSLVGSGPDPSFRYAWRVARWFHSEYNPFAHGEEYQNFQDPCTQAAIKLNHAFALTMHSILVQRGAQFEKRSSCGSLVRKTFSLVGEIAFPDSKVHKGVFTLAIGPDRKIFHSFFTKKTVNEIVSRLAQEGCYKQDCDESIAGQEPFSSSSGICGYQLPDDGSRITFESRECIEVTDLQGRILRALPFPDL